MKALTSFIVAGLIFMNVTAANAAQFPEIERLPSRDGFPPALVMLDGAAVTTAEQWRNDRRPELIALFEHYMYGAAPAAPKITATVDSEHDVLGGKAKMKQVTLRFASQLNPDKQGEINVLMFTPTKVQRAPVFVGLSFGGNHTVFDDPRIKLPTAWMPSRYAGVKDNRATDAGRGTSTSWPIEMIIDRGYAVTTAYHGEIDPDKKENDWSDGVHTLYYKPGQTRPGPHEWGTIAAWAWGLSRMADYLVTDGDVNGERMIVIGHSRNGKTALLAGALDERFAAVIPSQAGCGGTAPSRSTVGESVKVINTSFPHWFNDTFPKFNDATEKLPFDQHCLMALVAPRPLLLTNATGDQWANPAGQFQMLKLAEPVYKLLNAGGCDAEQMPPENELVNSRLGYFIRPGKHDMGTAEWQQWMEFADKHLPRAKN